jgi:hypothetical protein
MVNIDKCGLIVDTRGDYVGDHIHHPADDYVEDEEIFKTAQDRNITILTLEDFIRLLANR